MRPLPVFAESNLAADVGIHLPGNTSSRTARNFSPRILPESPVFPILEVMDNITSATYKLSYSIAHVRAEGSNPEI
jgi:hypothetical protein